ncbi:MAG: hypothetical protein O2788_02415, partial [Chloroflexi bacterium]|nr:hypothetical protein [Chloroflexota bacterium]
RLTKPGHDNARRIQQSRTATFSRLLESLNPDEHETVATGLAMLVDALNRRNESGNEDRADSTNG